MAGVCRGGPTVRGQGLRGGRVAECPPLLSAPGPWLALARRRAVGRATGLPASDLGSWTQTCLLPWLQASLQPPTSPLPSALSAPLPLGGPQCPPPTSRGTDSPGAPTGPSRVHVPPAPPSRTWLSAGLSPAGSTLDPPFATPHLWKPCRPRAPSGPVPPIHPLPRAHPPVGLLPCTLPSLPALTTTQRAASRLASADRRL